MKRIFLGTLLLLALFSATAVVFAQSITLPNGVVIPYSTIAGTGAGSSPGAQSTETTGVATGATFINKIYDLHQIPFNWNSQTTPFRNIMFLKGGYFVVAGTCSPVVTPKIERETMDPGARSNNIGIQGGLYVFKENGDFVDKRNVCYDGDIPGPTAKASILYCNEGAACESSIKLIATGDTTFVREMISVSSYGMNRPPLSYKVTSSKVQLIDKAYDGVYHWNFPENEGKFLVGNLVPVSGNFLGLKQTNENDGRQFSQSNILYSQGFGTLREWDKPYISPSPGNTSGTPFTAVEEIIPLAGVEDYVVGQKESFALGHFDTGTYVFRLKDNNTLQEVGKLPGFAANYGAPQYDPLNPKRVAFATNINQGVVSVDLYEAGTTTLNLVRSTTINTSYPSYYGVPMFSILGDYLVYQTCPAGNQSVLPVTGNSADPFKGCLIKVLKSGAEVASISLPKWRGFDGKEVDAIDDRASSMALSPNGYLTIGSDWGNLYLYKLGGNTGVGTPPPGGGGGGNIGTTTPGLNIGNVTDALDFAKGYLLLLQALFAAPSQNDTQTQGVVPEDGQYQRLFQTAVDLIGTYRQ